MMNAVVVDDEYLAIKVIEEYAHRFNDVKVVRTFTQPEQALDYLKANTVDLLFLDIQMPQLNGFDLLRKLPAPPTVIFTTARHDYAVQAFELDVLDYLVKPISPERFEKAVRKAEEYHHFREVISAAQKPDKDFLMVKADYRIHKINFDQIEYVEGLSEYVKIHAKERTYVTLLALKNLIEQLPSDQFVRIHKSYIVPINRIQSFTNSQVKLSNGKELTVGRAYKEEFVEKMKPN